MSRLRVARHRRDACDVFKLPVGSFGAVLVFKSQIIARDCRGRLCDPRLDDDLFFYQPAARLYKRV